MHVHVKNETEDSGLSSLPIILLCGVISVIDGFDAQAIGFAAAHIIEEWGLQETVAGAFFSTGFVGAIFGGLIAGYFYRLLGTRRVLSFWLIWVGLASLANAVAGDYHILLMIRLAGGVGLGALIPILISTVTEAASGKTRGRAISLVVAGAPIGGALAGSVYGLVSIELGWRSIFIIGGILPLAMVPLVFLMIPSGLGSAIEAAKPAKETRPQGGTSDSALRDTLRSIAGLFQEGRALATITILLTAFCGTLLGITLMNWTPLLLKGLSFSEEMSAAGGVALNVGALLSIFGFGYLLDRTGSGWVVCIGFMAGFALLLISGIAPLGIDMRIVAMMLIGFFAIGPNSGVWYLVSSSYSGDKVIDATSIGLVVARLGGVAGPVLVGWLVAEGLGSQIVFQVLSLIAALAAVGAAAFLMLMRRRRQGESIG